jgi:hypothetical protein
MFCKVSSYQSSGHSSSSQHNLNVRGGIDEIFPFLLFGRITRELCWTNWEFSPVDIIPLLFLIYHLVDEQ